MYTSYVTDDNIGVVLDGDEVVFMTRPCRLSVQAARLAKDWIDEKLQVTYRDAIELKVQNVVIDPDTLFGKRSK